jgi:hypothetical protein
LFPKTGNPMSDSRVADRIERFRQCYEAHDLANFTGTAYHYLMAVADYTSHRPLKSNRYRESHFEYTVARPADLLTTAASFFTL